MNMKNGSLILLLWLQTVTVFAQLGVQVELPLTKLHVVGDVQLSGDIKVGGSAIEAGDPGLTKQVLMSNGNGEAPSWETLNIPEIPAETSGSLIVVKGKLLIAEELTYLMSADFVYDSSDIDPKTINTINKRIVDPNINMNNGTFKVAEDGTYLITINALIQYVSVNQSTGSDSKLLKPVVGVWEDDFDNGKGKWLARINNSYRTEPTEDESKSLQMYSLITSLYLTKDTNYSFRTIVGVNNVNHKLIVKANSGVGSNSGPVSYFSVKRVN